MKKSFLGLLSLLALTLLFSCASTKQGEKNKKEKPVILITAFGSSYETGLKNLEDMDKAYQKAFPGYDIRWGFSADFIVKKLRRQGVNTIFDRQVPLRTIKEAYQSIEEDGKTEVAVQILMVMVGSEMRQIINTPTKGLNIKFAYPLFFMPEDIQNTANALSKEFGDPNTSYTLLSAHGNDHHMVFNSELIEMNDYLSSMYKNTALATVEGAPLFSEELAEKIKASGVSQVKFVPLMLTYGDHITNDIMGDELDSWKRVIGLPATASNGMASNPEIQKIYISKTKQILSQF